VAATCSDGNPLGHDLSPISMAKVSGLDGVTDLVFPPVAGVALPM
jgi:hypothetical protein